MQIGTTQEADFLDSLEKAVFRLKNQGKVILNFSEFSDLLRTQKTTPSLSRLSATVQEEDPILSASEYNIGRKTTLTPAEYKRLRYAFLLKKHNETIYKKNLHEEQILNHLWAKETPSLLDFQEYLARFFREDFTPFFSQRAFRLHIDQLKAHSYITAGSRHGKSELVKRLIYGAMESGHSAIILDPHGDLAQQVAHWREFAKDPERLVYFDPYLFGDSLKYAPVLNPLSPLLDSVNKDSVVGGFIDTMTSVIDSKDAPTDRMKSILKACLYTFASYPKEVTLYDLIDFLGNGEKAEFWKGQARQRLNNKALLAMVDDFDKKEYGNTKTAIRDRLRVLLSSDALDRCLIGQNTINLSEAMDSGKIIVLNLAKGRLGKDSSNAFGRLLLSTISASAMQRQAVNKDKRKPVFLFMDEGDNYMSQNVIEIYKETGKYGLFITFIQQVAGFGMTGDQWRAIRTNSLLRFVGNVGGDSDGLKIVSEMISTPKEDILSLKSGNFWLKYGTDTPQKMRVGSELVDSRHSMPPQDWQAVREMQRESYYRERDSQSKPTPAQEPPPGGNHQAQPCPAVATAKTTKKPTLNFDL